MNEEDIDDLSFVEEGDFNENDEFERVLRSQFSASLTPLIPDSPDSLIQTNSCHVDHEIDSNARSYKRSRSPKPLTYAQRSIKHNDNYTNGDVIHMKLPMHNKLLSNRNYKKHHSKKPSSNNNNDNRPHERKQDYYTETSSEIVIFNKNDFKLDTLLDQGSFGEVWKSHTINNTQKVVAIKKINKMHSESVKTEIDLMNLCVNCEQICTLFGSFEDEYFCYLVMEFIQCGSVQKRIESEPNFFYQNEDRLALLSLDVLKALEFMHTREVMHRDLKPANILIDSKNKYKLIDFGISKDLLRSLGKSPKGTCHYMAPEVHNSFYENEKYSKSADIWSFGVILYKLGCKQFPFDVDNESSYFLTKKILQDPVPLLPQCQQGFEWNSNFVDFVGKCLDKRADHRFTVKQLLEHPFVNGLHDKYLYFYMY